MEIYSQVEAYALSIMIEQAKTIFGTDSEDKAELLVNIPFDMIKEICIQRDSKLYTHVSLSDEQRVKSINFMSEVLKEKESLLKDCLNLYSSIVNPIGKSIRESIAKDFDESPQLRKVTVLLRGFGLDIVLGIFDELINRGVAPQDLLNSLVSYQQKVSPSDNFQEVVKSNIELEIISGIRDTKEAKRGELVGNIGGAVAGVKVGAVIGSFIVPGLGTAVGAAVGGSLGRLFGKNIGNAVGQGFIDNPEAKSDNGNKSV